jgi:hypothetical protein
MISVVLSALLTLAACASGVQSAERPVPVVAEGEAAPEPAPACPEGRFADEVFGCQSCPRFFTHDELMGWCTRWVPAGLGSAERTGHSATLLPDDRVLAVGGLDRGGHALASTDLFDPSAVRWAGGPALATPRAKHTATLLDDGHLLIVGGRDDQGSLESVEIFDPGTDTWSPEPPLREARSEHAAVKLADGRVLVVGGSGAKGPLKSVEIYDPAERRWLEAASLPTGRSQASATLLPDGSVMLVGGYGPLPPQSSVLSVLTVTDSPMISDLLRYEPVSDRWVSIGRLPRGAGAHTAALLGQELIVSPEARVMMLNSSPEGILRVDIRSGRAQYDHPQVTNGHWQMAPQASGLVMTWVQGTTIMTIEEPSSPTSVWIPSAELGPSYRTLAPMLVRRQAHTLTTLADGRILALGGASNIAETHRAELLEWVQGLRNARVVAPDDPLRPRPLR